MALNSGVQWYITDPHPDDVRLEDIAHSLSLICRYGGHCREFYSVAQHSCFVSSVIHLETGSPFLALHGLIHDAAEAYLGDVVRPLKITMPEYKALELRTEDVILSGLGIAPLLEPEHRIIKKADDVMLMTERRDLMNHCGHEWTPRAEPIEARILPLGPGAAKDMFLAKWRRLNRLLEAERGAK